MKLRIESGGTVSTELPDDLTGHAITIDLSRVGGTESGAASADLIRELLDRGAAKLVISEAAASAPSNPPHTTTAPTRTPPERRCARVPRVVFVTSARSAVRR